MRNNKYAALICVVALTTACNGAGNAAGSSANSVKSAMQQVNINQIRQSVTTAQSALQNAETTLGTIFNSDGSFNWNIFLPTGGADFSKLGTNAQQCLANAFPTQNVAMLVLTAPNDIATALKCILDDVVQVAGIAKTDMDSATILLNAALAQTTPGSPDYVAIQSMISEVQSLQGTYTSTLTMLAGQLNLAVTFLNDLPTMASGLIPIPIAALLGGMVIQSFVQPIVVEIIHFQDQLQSL